MKPFPTLRRFIFGFVAALAWTIASCHGFASAADSADSSSSNVQQESVKIEPYTGKPIFLPEPEHVHVEPKLVNHETLREKLGGGRIEREIAHYSDNSFAADGKYREFYPNDKIFVEGQFRKGRQEGEWKYYFDNGQLNRKATFNDGKLNGSWDVYRADGTLQAKRGFKDGLRDGEWITYDDTGKKPLAEEHYIAGEQDGVWKTWYPSGQQKQQAGFKNGKRSGATIEWNDKGQKVFEAEFTDNKLNGTATRWFADGHKIVQQYENGKLKSESKQ
jgi:antitoxin component YwqK of YwqJK toxin-antitoxin module